MQLKYSQCLPLVSQSFVWFNLALFENPSQLPNLISAGNYEQFSLSVPDERVERIKASQSASEIDALPTGGERDTAREQWIRKNLGSNPLMVLETTPRRILRVALFNWLAALQQPEGYLEFCRRFNIRALQWEIEHNFFGLREVEIAVPKGTSSVSPASLAMAISISTKS